MPHWSQGFFFFSQSFWVGALTSTGVQNIRVPSGLERSIIDTVKRQPSAPAMPTCCLKHLFGSVQVCKAVKRGLLKSNIAASLCKSRRLKRDELVGNREETWNKQRLTWSRMQCKLKGGANTGLAVAVAHRCFLSNPFPNALLSSPCHFHINSKHSLGSDGLQQQMLPPFVSLFLITNCLKTQNKSVGTHFLSHYCGGCD